MKPAVLPLLRCPRTYQGLRLECHDVVGEECLSGWLASDDGRHRYPIRNGIPRFVPESNYADSFGLQWTSFAKTQLDSHSGTQISSMRFWKATGWRPEDIKGQWVVDVGCGAGRFAEICLEAGAYVVAVDYSSAADVCYANLKHHSHLHVVQGDIYALPFSLGAFPFVYSLGVLQHTPDVARAFAGLATVVAPGGRVCVDYYEKSLTRGLLPKYWLRPFTKRIPKPLLFAALQRMVPALLAMSRSMGRVPRVGRTLSRLVPVANYDGVLQLSERQMEEWALLDTFDWLSPQYDNPQTAATAREWLHQAGMTDVEVLRAGHLVARGVKA